MAAYLVGIAGGSGSGKTTLISMIQAELGADNVSVVSQDDYYLRKEEQVSDSNGELNFDLPSAIDSKRLIGDVETLMSGQEVQIDRYTFNNLNDLSNRITIKSVPIIVVEGLFVFHFSELQQHFNFKIFVDAKAETRFNRRLDRDMNERGYPEEVIRYQWEHHVEPAYREFLMPHRAHSNVIIDNEYDMREGLEGVLDTLKEASAVHTP